jgi:hypothetical protein
MADAHCATVRFLKTNDCLTQCVRHDFLCKGSGFVLFFGNLVSMVGCILMVAIGFVRKKERVITLQCFQFGILGLSNLILGATSGFISGMVSVARNLIFPRVKGGLWLKLLFILIQVGLTLLVGVEGFISLLPLFAGVLFTWFMDARSDVQIKVVIIGAQILWAMHDLSYRNYVAFTFDLLTIASNAFGILLLKREGMLSWKQPV